MLEKILKYKNSRFLRNVIVVASGTAVAQIITVAFSPVITRLYGPEAFGLLGTFLALTHTLSPLAGLSYPAAIVLPKDDTEAEGIVRLSRNISLGISLSILLVLLIAGDFAVGSFNLGKIGYFIYLAPVTIIFASYYQSSQQIMLRKKLFKLNAKVTVIQALLLNLAKSCIGLFYPLASVLIVIAAIDNAFLAAMQSITIKRSKKWNPGPDKVSLRHIAKKYYDFPVYRAPQSFINNAAENLPVLLLAGFFGPAAAGFYSIGRKVLTMTTRFIGKSVENIFYPYIADAANQRKTLSRPLIKTIIALALTGIIPFGSVMICGPWLFRIVFGPDWVKAGEYARWIALWTFFIFINQPAAAILPVLSLQKLFLYYEILSTCLLAAGICLGFYLFSNDLYAIAIFCVLGGLLNAFLIVVVIKKVKEFDLKQRKRELS
jgi:O-antigen/teichoic acid export membrane protein